MKVLTRVVSAAVLLTLGGTVAAAELPTGGEKMPLSVERQAELRHLLKQDCGSCHGMTLKGGLGPSLRLDDIQGHTIDSLKATILLGRPGTAMPPWNRLISDQDAEYIAEQLLAGIAEGE